jgi:two-component system, NtrC family, sensor histidine kinase HydH
LLGAPVLVSLVLVAASIAGAFYLNQFHREVSRVLTENVASALAAKDLETTILELAHQLRGDHSHSDTLTAELNRGIRQINEYLEKAKGYADTDPEKEHVRGITVTWVSWLKQWVERERQPSRQLAGFDRGLARQLEEQVLPLCAELHNWNTGQVAQSDSENRRIVDRLTWGLLAVGVGAPISGLVLGYAVARRLHQSIYQLSVRIRDAAGRLNSELRPVTLEGDGDLPALNRQMQGIIDEIERVFQRLQQREREVLRAEQLAAVGQVAAGVAHELRNPLTSVKMLVQTGLEGDPPTGLPGEDLAIIEHEIRRMEGCIQTFLDFARPPSSERRRTDLLTVVCRALALIEGRARRQNILIETEWPPDPVELFIDGEQIHQVLVNLLLNALDAMPHDGKLRLEVHQSLGDPGRALVRIQDTGPGIAAPILARLFEPFVSGKETGLGLGLSICRRLLEAHGGTITGENAPDGGAVFTFTLPA